MPKWKQSAENDAFDDRSLQIRQPKQQPIKKDHV
jgi:hypothetical protein